MASEVDICNHALSLLGNDANVSSIAPSDGSKEADYCVTFYPMARDRVLSMHAWSFATKRQALALITPAEQPGNWAFAYARPSDCLQPISVLAPTDVGAVAVLTSFPPDVSAVNNFPPNADDAGNDYIEESLADGTRVLYTNVQTAWLRYVRNLTDTAKITPLCQGAIARLLASLLAGPILKGDEGRKETKAQLELFIKFDFPAAAAADAKGQRRNNYNNFTPDGLAARR